jgi:hypothetical protein
VTSTTTTTHPSKENTKMADLPFQFGTRVADDYKQSESDGAQWIRGFPTGSTQIRLAPCESTNEKGKPVYGYQAWTTEREHFDPDLQISYPCTEEYGVPEPEGMGCKSPSARVRERNRKYYVNAFNQDNELKVFKFGPVVWKAFKRRQDRMVADNPDNQQPLSDRDYIIHRSGSGKQGTEYEVENGETYEWDFPDASELHDIPAALKAQWEEAVAKYSGDEPLSDGDGDEEARPAPRGRINQHAKRVEPDEPRAGAKKAVPAAKKAVPAAKKAAAKPESNGNGQVTEEELDDMEIADLRSWVSGKVPPDYELPERATRSQLMKIARPILAGEPPF